MNLLLPKGGSIVVIDDQYQEAKPLIDLLAQNGYSSIYFNGDISSLPANPIDRVRILFADIQLIPALSPDQYASMITDQMDKLISDDNGPFVMIVWSNMEQVFADTVQARITAPNYKRKPIAFLKLNKADYFDSDVTNLELDGLEELLQTRFDNDDTIFILDTIRDKSITTTNKKLKRDALRKISKKISDALKEYNAFQLLIQWENLIFSVTTHFTANISSIYTINEFWDFNFKNILSRLAEAQVGQHLPSLKKEDFIFNSIKTLNTAFSDFINSESIEKIKIDNSTYSLYKNSGLKHSIGSDVCTILWNEFQNYQLYINDIKKGADCNSLEKIGKILPPTSPQSTLVNSTIKLYKDCTPQLNARLFIDLATKRPIQPGLVYEIKVLPKSKQRFLKQTYLKKEVDDVITREELTDIKFVELEVSPNCDYAQKKWLKYRTISGILCPIEVLNKYELKTDDSFYISPTIKYEDRLYKIVFSFKLLKAVDIEEMENRAKKVLFRIKNEPMADIISKLAGHGSRIGLITMQ